MKTPHDDTAGPTLDLPVALIDPDPKNRKEHDKESLQSLADTIRDDGLIQPVVVRIHPSKAGRYQLEAGERRWRAFQLLKRTTIPARVIKNETEVGAVRKRAIENFQRENLTAMEEARMFRELCVEHKLTQVAAGKLANKGQSYVANSLRLLELPADVQELVQTGEIPRAHGIALAKWKAWPKAVSIIAKTIIKDRREWSSHDIERATLPCADEMVKAGLGYEINTYISPYYSEPGYTIPAKLQAEPGFFKTSYNTWTYLLPADPKAPDLWKPEKEKQDKARAEQEKAAKIKADASAKAAGKGKASKEAVERKKKLEKNIAARAAIDGTLAHAVNALKATDALDLTALAVLCNTVLAGQDVTYLNIEAAFPALGWKMPNGFEDKVGDASAVAELKKLGSDKMVKLTAVALMLSECDGARRLAGSVPDSAALIAGKSAAAPSVKVTVRSKGSDHFAKAGEAKASSTSDPEHAATAAAAKHFSCDAKFVQLLTVQNGSDGGAWIFTATKGGRQ